MDKSGVANPEQFKSLELWRGFAAIWILWHHSLSVTYKNLDYTNTLFKWYSVFISEGTFAVSIFLIISGYCIAASIERNRKNPWRFIKRRMIRIYPPFWISIILISIEVYLITLTGLQRTSALPAIDKVIWALPLIVIPKLHTLNPVYYTLTYFVHFYLLCFILIIAFKGRYFYIIIDLIMIGVLACNHFRVFHDSWNSVFILRWHLFEFFFGVLLYRILKDVKHWQEQWRKLIYYTAWIVVLFLFSKSSPYLYARYLFNIGVCGVLLLMYPFDYAISRMKIFAPFFWLGTISFSLYLTNIMVGPKLIGLVDRITTMGNTLYLIALTIGTIGSLLCARLFYQWFEKPFRKL